MKILAFDSTAKAASVAVCEDEKCLALYGQRGNGKVHNGGIEPILDGCVH